LAFQRAGRFQVTEGVEDWSANAAAAVVPRAKAMAVTAQERVTLFVTNSDQHLLLGDRERYGLLEPPLST
jgi:hypothetical protein